MDKIIAKLQALIDFLQGKKTYTVAIGMIVKALVAYHNNHQLNILLDQILLALAIMTGRSAISNVGNGQAAGQQGVSNDPAVTQTSPVSQVSQVPAVSDALPNTADQAKAVVNTPK